MSPTTNNVIAFPGGPVAAEAATLVVSAVLKEEPQTVTRVFGINDQLTLEECGQALRIMFGWADESVPMKFTAGSPNSGGSGANVPTSLKIGELLQEPGDTVVWQWGLWQHVLEVEEAFARDEATPNVLCIGGSGVVAALGSVGRNSYSFADQCAIQSDHRVAGGVSRPAEGRVIFEDSCPTSQLHVFDVAAINEQLTGEDSIRTTLSAVREDVADIVARSGVFEFIPLLQALDLGREGAVERDVAKQLAELPAEDPRTDRAGCDAALVTLLCLAALTSTDVRWEVSEYVMSELGWMRDDGGVLTGLDIEELCSATWTVLEGLGVVGRNAVAAVDRLDLLREALRRR